MSSMLGSLLFHPWFATWLCAWPGKCHFCSLSLRFFIWKVVGGIWNRTAVLNPFGFTNVIEIIMNAKSHLSGKYLYAQHLPTTQGSHGSSEAMVRALLGDDQRGSSQHGHCGSGESQLRGHGVVVISVLFQVPPLQRYNRNRFQGGIWKACSVTSSCVRFQSVPTGDPAVLFFFPDPDMLLLPCCPVPSLAL